MGEGHPANNRVWVSKSHHPLKMKVSDKFAASLVIDKQFFLMRNPLDNFISFFVFHAICSHGRTITNDLNEEFPEFWEKECQKIAGLW